MNILIHMSGINRVGVNLGDCGDPFRNGDRPPACGWALHFTSVGRVAYRELHTSNVSLISAGWISAF